MTESSIRLRRRPNTKSYRPPIEVSANQISSELQLMVGSGSTRLSEFVQRYRGEFKYDFFRRLGTYDDIESDVLRVIKRPLILYALNMNGEAIVDLAGLLERHVFLYIEEIFRSLASIQKFPEGKSIILSMLKNRRFPEVADYLFVLGIWNKNEKETAVKLYNMRNSIAHKNVKKIEDILSHGKSKGKFKKIISVLEVDMAMSEHDVVPDIFNFIRLLCKLSNESLRQLERYRIANAILSNKIETESEFFS